MNLWQIFVVGRSQFPFLKLKISLLLLNECSLLKNLNLSIHSQVCTKSGRDQGYPGFLRKISISLFLTSFTNTYQTGKVWIYKKRYKSFHTKNFQMLKKNVNQSFCKELKIRDFEDPQQFSPAILKTWI